MSTGDHTSDQGAAPPLAQPRDAATVVVLRDSAQGVEVYLVKRSRTVDFMAAALAAGAKRPPPVVMPVVWNDKESGRAYISLPGDPRHPLPDVLGGSIQRFWLAEGRYRAVGATWPGQRDG